MSRFRLWGSLLLVPALAALLSTVGCGGSDKPDKDVARSSGNKSATDGGAQKGSADSGSKPAGEKTALEAANTATLKGKVTYDGDPPKLPDLKGRMETEVKDPKDREVCLKGDTSNQLWTVSADKGVANVVVWLRPPEGKYFKIPADKQDRSKETVTMDQPNCAFVPHVVAINPSFWNPQNKKQKKTGQTFKVLNSAPMLHNTMGGGNQLLNPNINKPISPKGELVVEARPCKDSVAGGEDLLNLTCDVHKWMTSKVAVFDHPFYAVTKLDGTYEIDQAPAGAELEVRVWHESMDSLNKAKTEKITLNPGENIKNFKVKQP
jgi:hypothetical protein